ncbi:unnamed protein product [Citrullus colocynthis]|uniref:Cysteine-rich transmembrane domain-containing protein n=1 Tax=Citrullus colocynthis TaxID=252529 RepID=A0ABP0YBL4_9ROSI
MAREDARNNECCHVADAPNQPQPLPSGKKSFRCSHTQKKGNRSFLEGCIFALCCCWICDACIDVSVTA